MKNICYLKIAICLIFTLSSGCGSSPVGPHTGITSGLVGYWGFTEGMAIDESNSGNDGIISGTPVTVTGVRGQGLSFNGSTDWIDVTMADTLHLSTEFTIGAWVRDFDPTGIEMRVLWYGDDQSGKDPYQLLVHNGSIIVSVDDSGGHWVMNPPVVLSPQRWNFIAATMTSNSNGSKIIKAYTNGELAGELLTPNPGTRLSLVNPYLNIGSFGRGQNKYQGSIDEVCILDRALSSVEIKQVYDSLNID